MKRFFFFFIFLFAVTAAHAQGVVQLSTYYPSPFGKYDRIQLVPRPTLLAGACDAAAQGTLYIDENSDQVMICDAANWVPLIASGSWTQTLSTLYVTDTSLKVGIGTNAPTSRLHVNAPEGDAPPGVFLENTDITADGGSDGILGLRNNNITALAQKISLGGAGLGTEVLTVDARNNRVGIGTTAPANKLDVEGGVAVGATYSGTTAAPANGMIVEGGVGIGTTSLAGSKLYVAGRIETNNNVIVGNGQVVGSGYGLANMRIGFDETNGQIEFPSGNVGIGTTAPRTKLELGNDGAILATGTFGLGWTEPDLGAGTRLLWYPQKAAFRAGEATTNEWNNANIGTYSVAMGYNTKASNTYSTAMGVSSTASGIYSTAMGSSTTASGQSSTAMGSSTTASGQSSTAMGSGTTAGGGYSTAMGFYAGATGDLSTAMGYYTTAQAYASLVLGRFNVDGGTSNSWVATDPLFVIGNGVNAGSLSNAMTVYKNGNTEITGRLSTLGGLVIETRTTNPGAPVAGQMWLCTDTGDATPCNGI